MRHAKGRSDSKLETRVLSFMGFLTVLLKQLTGETLERGKRLASDGGALGIVRSKSLGRGPGCRENTGTERNRERVGDLRAEGKTLSSWRAGPSDEGSRGH